MENTLMQSNMYNISNEETITIIDKDGNMYTTNDGLLIINAYLNTLESPNTKRAYARSIMEFFTFLFGDNNFELKHMIIDPNTAFNYGTYLKRQLDESKATKDEAKKKRGINKTSTYNSKIKGVKAFYEWLITLTTTQKEKLFQINPFDIVRQISEREDAEGADVLELEEMLLMLNNPIGHSEHVRTRNRLMMELGVLTGIRNNALILAEWSTISKDVVHGHLMKVYDKGRKENTVPINSIYDRLREWYECDLKLRTENDKNSIFNIDPTHANRIMKLWAKSVGINKNITFHSLRVTTAKLVYDETKNIYEVQKYLRQSNVATADIYVEKCKKTNHVVDNVFAELLSTNDLSEEEIFYKLNVLTKEELVRLIMSDRDIAVKLLLK